LLDDIDVLLVAFRPGQMGAQAIIDVLLKGVEPRGRLGQSWPRNVGQVSLYHQVMSF
jgi:beta-glucosidase